jgi:hypothetical protein
MGGIGSFSNMDFNVNALPDFSSGIYSSGFYGGSGF